jgi:tetratricopeptide (TPR) repeat protein
MGQFMILRDERVGQMKKALSRLFTSKDTLDVILAEGDAAVAEGDLLKALSRYDSILDVTPRNGVVLSRKTAALISLNRLDESLQCAEMAISAAPDLAVAWYESARALQKWAN